MLDYEVDSMLNRVLDTSVQHVACRTIVHLAQLQDFLSFHTGLVAAAASRGAAGY